MVGVAQLVRAEDCGSSGRGFNSRHSPLNFCRRQKFNPRACAEDFEKIFKRVMRGGMRQCEIDVMGPQMLLIIRTKIDSESRKKIAEDLKGYIKVVVDVRRGILSAGGSKHVDGEKLLLKDGSRQEDLWGAGLDFDSMINLRPSQNTSREILDQKIREQVERITRSFLQE